MLIPILCIVASVGLAGFIGLIFWAIESLSAMTFPFMVAVLVMVWMLGVAFTMSVNWLKESYDDYKFEKALKKGFEK